MKSLIVLFIFIFSSYAVAQDMNFNSEEISISKWIDGTLLTPREINKPNLAIIIAGSGPTDRNGNQNFMKNNSLKKLAEALSNNNIATFRYDKRVVKQIRVGNFDNSTLFDDFVNDAKDVLNFFKGDERFSKLIIIGHSQGSLVGMLSAHGSSSGFISLAGAGQNIGDVILEQVSKTAPMYKDETSKVIEILKKGKTTKDYPPVLSSLFNSDIQPFMINWMQYNPTEILQTLQIPTLIVNGTKDLQVSVSEAELLKNANSKADLKIIENMNHVLFEIEGDDLENSKSYNESFREISPFLIKEITRFIHSI